MTNPIVLTIPEDISARAYQIAEDSAQPVETVLLAHLQTLNPALPSLLPEEQAELDALRHLSDDALWTIAREQMPEDVQARAHSLMRARALTDAEQAELDQLVERADRLMLRKAEAASLLRRRGHSFRQQDFSASYE